MATNHHLLAQGTGSSRTFGPCWFHPVEPPDAVFILKDLLVWTINGHLTAYIQVPLLKSVAQGCFYLKKKEKKESVPNHILQSRVQKIASQHLLRCIAFVSDKYTTSH